MHSTKELRSMKNKMTIHNKLNFFLITSSLMFLSACGIRGELKTPPPIWNNTSLVFELKETDNKFIFDTTKDKTKLTQSIS